MTQGTGSDAKHSKGLVHRVARRSEDFPEDQRERFCNLVLEPPTIRTDRGIERDTSDPIKALFWEGYAFGPKRCDIKAKLYPVQMAGRFRHMLERYGHLPKAIPDQEPQTNASAAPSQRLRGDHGGGRTRDGSGAHG